ncbi:MAG: ABC transporter permease subunit [Phycisphaera sp.]|nr:ABC transporter permease subunit [Phycisphaera sp.]
MTRTTRRELHLGLVFISPWIVGFCVFTLYPLLASLYYSFCDYDVLSRPVWVGLLNYRDLFTDEVFWKSLGNTLVYASVSLPMGIIVSVMVAVLLNQPVPGRGIFRTLFFVPSILPLVAVAVVWLWMFNTRFGLVNEVITAVLPASWGQGPNWLGDERWVKPTIVLASLWQTGGTVVILLAALQEVPQQLYESATIDGGGAWVRFRHVTLPMISPVVYFNLVMGIINSLQVFVMPYVLLGDTGGPNRSGLFYSMYLYQNAFSFSQMGYACAMAWLLFVLIMGLTWLATRGTRGLVYYGGA